MKEFGVVFTKRKSIYAPMADAIIKESDRMRFDVLFFGENLNGYKNLIIFDNKTKHISDRIDCDKEANVGWWMNDLRPPAMLKNSSLAPEITHIFLCNKAYVDEYSKRFKKKVYYMPQAGHELSSSYGRMFKKNIVFIGQTTHHKYHKNREKHINNLKRFGLCHINNERTTFDQDFIYRNTPLSLSISIPEKAYTSNRTYNILASKGLAFMLWYPDIEKTFTNHQDVVWFRNMLEARELADYYINNKKDRDRIAENGYNLFLEKHRVRHRLQNMLDIMNGKTEKYYGHKV
jgi:spore maturation protein CgeB